MSVLTFYSLISINPVSSMCPLLIHLNIWRNHPRADPNAHGFSERIDRIAPLGGTPWSPESGACNLHTELRAICTYGPDVVLAMLASWMTVAHLGVFPSLCVSDG
jgi:hypothetical protein